MIHKLVEKIKSILRFVFNKNTSINSLKTFDDLIFEEHPNHMGGVQARIEFNNGYGASVVCTPYTYGGSNGLYELAVLDSDGHLTYDTPVTDDVIGHLTKEEVTNLLIEIQKL